MLGKVVQTTQPIFNETPSGDIDGTNVEYTTEFPFREETLVVFLNGLKLLPGAGNDYNIVNSQTIELEYAPLSGDILVVEYHINS